MENAISDDKELNLTNRKNSYCRALFLCVAVTGYLIARTRNETTNTTLHSVFLKGIQSHQQVE